MSKGIATINKARENEQFSMILFHSPLTFNFQLLIEDPDPVGTASSLVDERNRSRR